MSTQDTLIKEVKEEKTIREEGPVLSHGILKEEIHQPIVNPLQSAPFTHTGPHTQPVYETITRKGTHVVISQDVTQTNRNPIADVATAMARKEPVHNQQLGVILERSVQSLERERGNTRLDPQGQILAQDAAEVLQATEQLLYEKNKGEQLQNLVRHGGLQMMLKKKKKKIYNIVF
jgi:hypothetical protein